MVGSPMIPFEEAFVTEEATPSQDPFAGVGSFLEPSVAASVEVLQTEVAEVVAEPFVWVAVSGLRTVGPSSVVVEAEIAVVVASIAGLPSVPQCHGDLDHSVPSHEERE